MRRLTSLLAAAALLLPVSAVSACTSLQGTGDKGYVTGDGTIRQIASSDRTDPIALTGEDLDGRSLSLESLRGKPTVVTVWGSWCASCHKETPYLVAAQKRLGDKVNFVGIDSRDNGTAQAKSYNARYGVTWPSFFSPGGEALLAFPGVLAPNSVPATVVLDAQGRPAADISGAIPSSLTLVELVQDVLRNG
jgi:thiol-disulfide isomerase/thioredoxin